MIQYMNHQTSCSYSVRASDYRNNHRNFTQRTCWRCLGWVQVLFCQKPSKKKKPTSLPTIGIISGGSSEASNLIELHMMYIFAFILFRCIFLLIFTSTRTRYRRRSPEVEKASTGHHRANPIDTK